MAQVFKIALPGYNALTDTDPNHFALYVDQLVDYVLIKEKLAATVSVTSSLTIAHGLSYVPFCLVFFEISSGVWRKTMGNPADGIGGSFTIDSTNLTLYGTGNCSYRIFYDNLT